MWWLNEVVPDMLGVLVMFVQIEAVHVGLCHVTHVLFVWTNIKSLDHLIKLLGILSIPALFVTV